MKKCAACAPRPWFVIGSFLLGLSVGCSSRTAKNDYTLRMPEGWTKASTIDVDVAGQPIELLEGPSNAKLVIYRSLPIPSPDAEALSRDVANRLRNLPGLHIVQRDVKTIRGRKAAWVEAIAPGNAWGIAASGTGVPKTDGVTPLVPTRQLLVGFPRAADTLWMRWTFPKSAEEAIRPQIVDTLEELRLSDPVVKAQTY